MSCPPPRYPVFNVLISATTYDEAADCIMEKAVKHESGAVTYMPVHSLMMAARDPKYREIVNAFDMACPDGQPVRHSLRLLHGVALNDRVYGPEHMLRLCGRAAKQGVSIYLYGSTAEVVEKLGDQLEERFPGLKVVGRESPPFRPLSDAEVEETVARMNGSGAGLFFVGLGTPRQDEFVGRVSGKIKGVLLCVGAAFDFHSGNKPMAPAWMQKNSLEWLFRLSQEPRRLLGRYFITNSMFLLYLAREMAMNGISRLLPARRGPGKRGDL